MKLLLPGLFLLVLPSLQAEPLSYSRDIRPVLSKNCFACHGPDEEKVKGKTRLDVPEQADLKELVSRIHSTDPDEIMPPPEANKTLKPDEIALLERWVAEGAPYEQHWAFVPPLKADVPAGEHPVDWFIDQRLAADSLQRSPIADPYTRIRRVFLDLTGLPPSPEEADAFAADPSPAAWAAVVDRLLASPAYGERWARHWMDLARYADTSGYEKDRDRTIWPWRDWVISALNRDLGFDEFTIEQLAGDMLPQATADQITATGFHRNTMLNEEGGIDPLEFRYHAMTDRVATTGTTWLGLTTGCAQCHTHKFDPITHRDYFGMMAYLNNTDEPEFRPVLAGSATRQQKNLIEAATLLAALPDKWPAPDKPDTLTLDQAFTNWLAAARADTTAWSTLIPDQYSANIPYLTLEDDGIIIAAGDTSKFDIYTLTFPAQDHAITALRLEALTDSRLPGGGPGLTYYEGPPGDFYLSEFAIKTAAGDPVLIDSTSETASNNAFSGNPATARQAIDGDVQTGWSVGKGAGRPESAVFHLAAPIPAGTAFTIQMDFSRHYASPLGKFRLSATDSTAPLKVSALTDSLRAAAARPDAASDPAIRQAFLLQAPELAAEAAKIRALEEPVTGPPTLVMRERPAAHQRPTFLHNRGEYTQPRDEVKPRLPAALWPEDQPPPADRLAFARWLVSRENPLTARVVANRQWAALFGTGIVKTVDDFGMQGELPSHPALLDWLAVEFMERGWSLKSLHRLIVTSATYQQASEMSAPPADVRLLARFPRTRLEGEIIRDAALQSAGLLSRKMYGPPIRPPQPAAAAANYSQSKWNASEGEERFRRSVYIYQKRTAPFAMLTTFDGGSGEACLARRDVSNTPLQALTLMNDPMFMEIADGFGKRIAALPGEPAEKIRHAFRLVLTRPPGEPEMQTLTAFHTAHPDWSALARALLCLDESITRN